MSERVPGSIEAREGAGRLVREELECGVERLVAIGQRNDARPRGDDQVLVRRARCRDAARAARRPRPAGAKNRGRHTDAGDAYGGREPAGVFAPYEKVEIERSFVDALELPIESLAFERVALDLIDAPKRVRHETQIMDRGTSMVTVTAVMICLMALSVAATLTAGASAKKSHSNSTNAEATHSRPSLAPARNVLGVLAKQYSLDAQVCPGRCGHVHARRRLAVATEVTRISCAFTAASRKPCAAREHQSLNLQGYGFEHAIARMARNVLYRAS